MHLGGNRRQVPLTNEALSIIIYVKKLSRYAMLRRINRCKSVLYLVLHRTEKTRICELKTLQKTRLRCEKHIGKGVSVSGYILVSPFFHVSVAAFITDETITIIQQYYRIYFVFQNFDETNKRDKFQVIPCQDMLDVEQVEISGLMSEYCGRLFCEFWATKLILSGFGRHKFKRHHFRPA